ncbi:MAG: glycosyltransferase, partial [Parabacteroides sp.]
MQSVRRIAILSPFYPYRGGIAQFSGRLYAELSRQGYEVQAFNFTRLYPDLLFPGKTQYVEEGDRTLAVESDRTLDSINPLTYFRTVTAIRRFRPDLLIISYWMPFFVPAYAHIANRLKRDCRVVALVHNAISHEGRWFDPLLLKLFFNQCDGFIVLSEAVRQTLQELFPKATCFLSPHPLYDHFGETLPREEACRRLQLDPARKTLLFFGLIRDYKGLDLLIEAMDRLDDSYQLLIAGECYGSFEKYEQLRAASSARDRIFVHNHYISDQDIPLFFSAADALVLPYRSATQSGVLSVAYHYNLPVLATPVGDFPNSI